MQSILFWTLRIVVGVAIYTFIATLLWKPFVKLYKKLDIRDSEFGALMSCILWVPYLILALPFLVVGVLPWHTAMMIMTRKERAEKARKAAELKAKKEPNKMQQELMDALKLNEALSTEEVVESFLKGRLSLEEFNRLISR